VLHTRRVEGRAALVVPHAPKVEAPIRHPAFDRTDASKSRAKTAESTGSSSFTPDEQQATKVIGHLGVRVSHQHTTVAGS